MVAGGTDHFYRLLAMVIDATSNLGQAAELSNAFAKNAYDKNAFAKVARAVVGLAKNGFVKKDL